MSEAKSGASPPLPPHFASLHAGDSLTLESVVASAGLRNMIWGVIPFTALCLRTRPERTNPWRMAVRVRRRLLCLLTALLFAVGSVAQVYAGTEAAMTMPSTAMAVSEHGMSGMDCGGNGKAAHAACVAMCATAVAILNEPIIVPMVLAMQNVAASPEQPPLGRGPSPEPHPPKR